MIKCQPTTKLLSVVRSALNTSHYCVQVLWAYHADSQRYNELIKSRCEIIMKDTNNLGLPLIQLKIFGGQRPPRIICGLH